MYVCMNVCMYACMYVFVCVCVCVCVYTPYEGMFVSQVSTTQGQGEP